MKKFWVGLTESDLYFKYYEVEKFKRSIFDESADGLQLCREEFEKLTGLKLKPGEIVQCELKVIKKG